MRFNAIKTVISLLLTALIVLGFSAVNKNESLKLAMIISSSIIIASSMIGFLAIDCDANVKLNMKASSLILFVLFCLVNFVFSFVFRKSNSLVFYIIISGILFLTYVLVAYSLFQHAKTTK